MPKSRDEGGFSLVELMVVVMIIGILIAIAIPSLIGARERAQNRAAQSNIRNAVAAANVLYTDSLDFTQVTESTFSGAEPSLTFAQVSASPAGNASPKRVNFLVESQSRIVMGVRSDNGNCYYAQDNKATSGVARGARFMDGPKASGLGGGSGCTALDDTELALADPDWNDEF